MIPKLREEAHFTDEGTEAPGSSVENDPCPPSSAVTGLGFRPTARPAHPDFHVGPQGPGSLLWNQMLAQNACPPGGRQSSETPHTLTAGWPSGDVYPSPLGSVAEEENLSCSTPAPLVARILSLQLNPDIVFFQKCRAPLPMWQLFWCQLCLLPQQQSLVPDWSNETEECNYYRLQRYVLKVLRRPAVKRPVHSALSHMGLRLTRGLPDLMGAESALHRLQLPTLLASVSFSTCLNVGNPEFPGGSEG